MKNTLEGINRRLVDTEKHSNLEDRLINITQSEQQNEVHMQEEFKELLRQLKCINVHFIRASEGEEKKG